MQNTDAPIRHPDRFFIGGEWVEPSTDATLAVIDPSTEEVYLRVAEAQGADIDRAVTAARHAFDAGPWRHLAPAERAGYLRAFAAGLQARGDDLAELWPHEAGVLHSTAKYSGLAGSTIFGYYAQLAETFAFEDLAQPMGGQHGILAREPVGVVGAIVPWNGPLSIAAIKVAPALLAGCTVVLKAAPQAPGEAYVLAEIAAAIGLPPGVLNVVTAEREASELLVRDPRVDKIAFTGSTAAGRRIAAICGERVARYTLELGGKSAAVILDDADIDAASAALAAGACTLSGQVCAALTRIIVPRTRHDEIADALAAHLSKVRVGDPFDAQSQMGPLAMERQRDRVEGYIQAGLAEGAKLVTGGGRPAGLTRGWYVEPTVFADVDNSSTIAQEEIFGPVLSVIPADDEDHAIALANDSIYGLNGAVFTEDVERANRVARRLRAGTVGHNGYRADFTIGFGGFKQSGVGREGGPEGLLAFLESKTIVLESAPGGGAAAG